MYAIGSSSGQIGLFQAVFSEAIAHISESNPEQHTDREMQRDEGWLGKWRIGLKHWTRTWTSGKIKLLLLKGWALSIYSKHGVGWGGAGLEGAMQHLMKSKFSLILVQSKPHIFQLQLQSIQTSFGSLILITQWILAVPALLYQFARYFQPAQRSSCSSASKQCTEEVLYRVSESVYRCLITLGEEVGGQGDTFLQSSKESS